MECLFSSLFSVVLLIGFLRLIEGVAYVCISAFCAQVGTSNVNIMLVASGREFQLLSSCDSLPNGRQAHWQSTDFSRCHHLYTNWRPLEVRGIHIGISVPGHSIKHCSLAVGVGETPYLFCLSIPFSGQGVARCGRGEGLFDPRTGLIKELYRLLDLTPSA